MGSLVNERIRYIQSLYRFLEFYKISTEDICLLSSCAIAIKGIKSNNDIEFAMKTEKRRAFEKKYADEYEYNKFSRVLKINSVIDNCSNMYANLGINDMDLFSDYCAEKYDGIRIVNLEIYTAQLLIQNREKDNEYVRLIRNSGIWSKEFSNKVDSLLLVSKSNGLEVQKVNREVIWKKIFDSDRKIYIFGTGHIGEHVYQRVLRDGYSDRLSGFAVSEQGKCEVQFCNKQVKTTTEIIEEKPIVIVAVMISIMAETIKYLTQMGFEDVIQGFQFMLYH